VLVPLGTRTGFNTRNDAAGFPWATGRWDGSFVPFPRTDLERQRRQATRGRRCKRAMQIAPCTRPRYGRRLPASSL
jgi:hypothetical protein